MILSQTDCVKSLSLYPSDFVFFFIFHTLCVIVSFRNAAPKLRFFVLQQAAKHEALGGANHARPGGLSDPTAELQKT